MKFHHTFLAGLLGTSSLLAAPFYKKEVVPLPEGEVIEVGSIALLPDKKLAVAGRRGDVWIVEGAYEADLSKVKWSKFAEGLHEPFGAYWQDGSLYLMQRSELTKLTDTDGDGLADSFENVNDDWSINGNYHEYAFGSTPDAEGNVYNVLCLTGSGGVGSDWRGWSMKITPDGEMIPFAYGIRSPGGIGYNDKGDLFYTDNQGLWNGSSSLKWLKPGGFMGNPKSMVFLERAGFPTHPEPVSETRIESQREIIPNLIPPAVVFPHGLVGQSPTGVITDKTESKFGPFAGQVLVGEQTHSQVQRVDLEMVNGFYQGAVFPFLDEFQAGIVPLVLSDDGTLFTGGTNRGWGSRGELPFSLERATWSGETPFEVLTMRITDKGFRLTFTKPVDPATAADPKSYAMKAWTYIYKEGYGSPEVDKTEPKITAATVSDDGKTVELTVDGRVKGHVHHLMSKGVKSADGKGLWHTDAYYTLNEFPAK